MKTKVIDKQGDLITVARLDSDGWVTLIDVDGPETDLICLSPEVWTNLKRFVEGKDK